MSESNYKTAEYGFIYCLWNESFPHLVKIGMTTTCPHQRAKQLSSTGLPTPFRVEFAKYVRYPYEKEQKIHHILKKNRVNHHREHFEVSRQDALTYFELLDGEWGPAPHPTLQGKKPTKKKQSELQSTKPPQEGKRLSPIQPKLKKSNQSSQQSEETNNGSNFKKMFGIVVLMIAITIVIAVMILW